MRNSLHEGALEPDLMWEMMIIAMLNYQADEFLEAVVDEHMMDQLHAVRALVERLCADANGEFLFSNVDGNGNGNGNGETTPKSNGIYEKSVSLNGDVPGMDYAKPVLRRFITYILTHPAAIRSPPSVQRTLRRELKVFILAHNTHAEDNARFLSQSLAADRTTQFATPCSYYYSWVRSTSADHTSCPYSFHFLSCLIAKPGGPAFKGARQRGIWQSTCAGIWLPCADSTMTMGALFGIERRRI